MGPEEVGPEEVRLNEAVWAHSSKKKNICQSGQMGHVVGLKKSCFAGQIMFQMIIFMLQSGDYGFDVIVGLLF